MHLELAWLKLEKLEVQIHTLDQDKYYQVAYTHKARISPTVFLAFDTSLGVEDD